MARRTTLWDHLRWDLLAFLILIVLVFGYSAIQEPRFRPAEPDVADGSKPPDRTEGDVLLITPVAPASQAREFEQLDCTFAWYNALWHYYGTFASAPANDITPQVLAGHTVVIVPARVAVELSTTARSHLERFAREGGQLVVEMPRRGWEPIIGLSTIGQIARAGNITSVEGLGDDDPRTEHLSQAPLAGRLLPSDDLEHWPLGPVLFDVNDRAGLVAQSLGEGQVYAILFDLACSITAMYQGYPTERMAFGPPGRDRFAATAERVREEEMLTASAPYADLLVRAVLDRIPERRPLARLWPFPAGYAGAAMSIHAADTNPRAVFGYADHAHDEDAATTLFVAPDHFSANHAALASAVNADVGLLWVLGEQRPPITEGVGVGAIQPWERELPLGDQQAMLDARRDTPVYRRLVRTEGAYFETDWASTFHAMAGANITLDASFGPSDPSQHGYLFGTGMPFHPMDARGRLFSLLEAPFVLDGASVSSERLETMFAQSRDAFHQPLVISLGADAMRHQPSAGIMLGFRDFHDLARHHDHWLTTLSDYVDFLTARRESVITSQWSEPKARLTVSVNLLGAKLATAPEGAIPAVAVPARYENREIEALKIDDESLSPDDLTRSGPGDELLLELGPGRHVITIYYQSSSDDEDDEDEDDEP